MRLSRNPQTTDADPFSEITEWTDELTAGVVHEIEPLLAAETAQQAATAALAAAASPAAVGIAAGAVSGGTTMTSATATMTGTAGIFSSLGSRIAAGILAGVTVTGGLAATGNLPHTVQTTAADLVERVGIELPRPGVARVLEMVDVGSAGTVSLELIDGVISVVDLAAAGGWETAVEQQNTGKVTVTFAGAGGTLTVQAVVADDGSLATTVSEVAAPSVSGDAGAEANLEGSVSTDESTGSIELDTGIELDGTLEIGN